MFHICSCLCSIGHYGEKINVVDDSNCKRPGCGWRETKTASVYTKQYRRRGVASVAMRLSQAQGGPRFRIRGSHSDANASKIREKETHWQPVGESNPSSQVENLVS
jgi:hypothetical protein